MSSSPKPGTSTEGHGHGDDEFMSTSSDGNSSMPSLPYDSDRDPEFVLKVRSSGASSGESVDTEQYTDEEEDTVRRRPKKRLSMKKAHPQTKGVCTMLMLFFKHVLRL